MTVALASVMSVMLCAAALGCSKSVASISIDRDIIMLYVGETRDIIHYVKFLPSTATDKNISLCADGDCVAVDGSSVRAVKCGDCAVTVLCGEETATVNIKVAYRAPQRLGISASGLLEQTVAENSKIGSIEFSAVTNGYADPELNISWSVNGVQAASGSEFDFTPSGYGEYDITATAAGLTATETVRVYKPTKTTVSVVGELEQNGKYSEVKYIAVQAVDRDNPRSVYEWRVNGEAVGNLPVFSFTPVAQGEYVISLVVNGANVPLGDIGKITATGERTPNCSLSFDDEDGVYITGTRDATRITVVSPSGKRRDISRTDAQYSYLFKDGRFDATELVAVCAENPGEYTITVTDVGKTEFGFMQYPAAAKEYLDKKPFIKNMFISNEDDGCELIDDIYAVGLTTAKVYFAREQESAVDGMADYARLLGLDCTVSMSGSVCTFDFSPYVSAPTRYDALPDVMRMYTELPHIEYDAEKRRISSYVFATDKIRRAVSVETSEQLVTAVMRGIRPDPKPNSAADGVYTAVKARLLGIIGKEYSDAQKVHAIYDWLQWVCIGVKSADSGSASSFAEGVFGTAVLSGGDARRAAVTSAGAAKSFALMCGVEGIECIIQAAVYGGEPYMSNKVKLGGLWYNVDVLGGKLTSDALEVPRPAELSSHIMLLTDDGTAAALGFACAGGEYASFDAERTVYCDKRAYGDRYITQSDVADYSAVKAAVFRSFSSVTLGVVSVPVIAGIESYMNNTLGAEFVLDAELTAADSIKLTEMLRRAADEYAQEIFGESFAKNAVKIYRAGSNIHLVASAAGMSAEGV